VNTEAAIITVDRSIARAHHKAYRTAVKAGTGTRDDVTLYKAYRALVRGQKVIDLPRAIGDAGVDQVGRPRLAVCRADKPVVFCRVYHSGVARFSSGEYDFGRQPRGVVDVPASAFGGPLRSPVQCRAMVPAIPPQYRPPAHQLEEHHILWEAEWLPRPVGDPMLLKYIDGPFYVVLAAWDLTPLEQAVMRQRL
jgi:hypothetical protein